MPTRSPEALPTVWYLGLATCLYQAPTGSKHQINPSKARVFQGPPYTCLKIMTEGAKEVFKGSQPGMDRSRLRGEGEEGKKDSPPHTKIRSSRN